MKRPPGNMPGPAISPAEVHANRFLLYAITFLLSTPSDFASVVEEKADVDIWLKNAGVDPDQAFSRRRNICVEYVNQITQHPTAYPLMAELHHVIRTVYYGALSLYTGKDCPTTLDSMAMLRCMIHLCENNGLTPPTDGAHC
jgi:hypothetical protein